MTDNRPGAGAIIATGFPLLLLGLQSVWAIIEPAHKWNQAWIAGLVVMLTCEYVILLSSLAASSLRGPREFQTHMSIVIGALLLFALTIVALAATITTGTEVVVGAGIRIAGVIADHAKMDVNARDARLEETFELTLIFYAMLAASAFSWFPVQESQQLAAAAAGYFLLAAALTVRRLFLRPPVPTGLTPGLRIHVLPGAVEFEYRGAWHRAFIGLTIGISIILAGVFVIRHAGVLFAMIALALGGAVVLFFVNLGIRRLRVRASLGEVAWEERTINGTATGRASVDQVGNPVVRTMQWLVEKGGPSVELNWELILKIQRREIAIPVQTSRAEGEAIGKLFAGTLKYGGDPRLRATLAKLPGIGVALSKAGAAGPAGDEEFETPARGEAR